MRTEYRKNDGSAADNGAATPDAPAENVLVYDGDGKLDLGKTVDANLDPDSFDPDDPNQIVKAVKARIEDPEAKKWKNVQSRKWNIRISNPLDHGLTRDVLLAKIRRFNPVYFCIADEIGLENGLPHVHVHIYRHPSAIGSSALLRAFPGAHLQKAYGTCRSNRDYVSKTGKWENDPKADQRVEGSFYEEGELPAEREAPEDWKARLYYYVVEEGLTNMEIISRDVSFSTRIKSMNELREEWLSDKYMHENRDLTVIYKWGATATYKTASIFEQHGPHDVARITPGRKGEVIWDAYHGQNVVVLEEFDSSKVPIRDMLMWADVYPTKLAARYFDRVACYEHLYVTSNLPLSRHYREVQQNEPETWKAFVRRIKEVHHHKADGTVEVMTPWEALEAEGCPVLDHAPETVGELVEYWDRLGRARSND